MQLPGPRRRGAMASRALDLLLLWCASVCLPLPSARAQAATFTSTIDGKEATTFSFPKFDKNLTKQAANMTFSSNSTISQNALQITPDSSNNAQDYLVNQAGRVFFSTPFVMWSSNSSNSTADGNYVASFSTVFRANLYRSNKTVKGEGLAFVIASSNPIEPPPGSNGGYLGLTNASTNGNATNGFAAVELDSVKQPYDIDDNHVGVNINGVNSAAAASLTPFGIQLAPSNTTIDDGSYFVWVDYNGTSRYVWVYMAKNDSKPSTAVLNTSLDLSSVLLGKKAYFGFSASTGETYQLNCVLMWNMTVEMLPDEGATKKAALSGWKLGVAVGVPCAAVVATGLFVALYIWKKKKKRIGDDPSSVFNNTIDFRSIPGVPKEFDFKELRRGTNNFDEKMKLGQGGYGVVYRATVVGENGQSMEVAVKQFSGANTKGQEDFLAELSIINRLRHRNLVKLVGWCHENGVLLLVYDYMPNGSLDKHIFGGPESEVLNWKQRYNVVGGVASALNYLHHEYDQMVIHRDIKPSNIMLDSAFNARLGDFGLARALESDKTSYTDIIGVPGTLGYIAPECFHTGRATRESDVFGFGAVILEIVCGRRISCSNPAGCSQLLEGVWRLHGAAGGGRILEAVDQRLAGEFDEAEAERLLLLGLACSHPNPGERPRTQAILQILTGAAPPPDVPPSKPAFMWPAMPVARDGDDDGETSRSSTVMNSSSSYYVSSSGWTQNYQVSKEHELADRVAATM
ncbi:probable L-type lectin-domain containing receptor kinase S.5 [Oryza brachyantha]|uniref:probable L-type lectin-domain containing receptor kinase S.5 n=1 Tax=Oryza brachyantha TaxID=4533 RepID=UPI001ADD45EC|nr:probable L-type lectin-domain containing receptor kinase S.5 [Oryza brachyantha]